MAIIQSRVWKKKDPQLISVSHLIHPIYKAETGSPREDRSFQWVKHPFQQFNFVHFFFSFLAYMGWELKWAFLIACNPLSVRPCNCLSVTFSHFQLLLQNRLANFKQTWHNASLSENDSNLFKYENSLTKFLNLLQNHLANFNLTWQIWHNSARTISTWRGLKFVQMQDHALFQGVIITIVPFSPVHTNW